MGGMDHSLSGLLRSVHWRKVQTGKSETGPQDSACGYVLGRYILRYLLGPEGRDHVYTSTVTPQYPVLSWAQ